MNTHGNPFIIADHLQVICLKMKRSGRCRFHIIYNIKEIPYILHSPVWTLTSESLDQVNVNVSETKEVK